MKSSMMISTKMNDRQILSIADMDKSSGFFGDGLGDTLIISIIDHCREWRALYRQAMELVHIHDLQFIIVNHMAVIYHADNTAGEVARVFQSGEKWTFEISKNSQYTERDVVEGQDDDEFFGVYDTSREAIKDACKVMRGETEV